MVVPARGGGAVDGRRVCWFVGRTFAALRFEGLPWDRKQVRGNAWSRWGNGLIGGLPAVL